MNKNQKDAKDLKDSLKDLSRDEMVKLAEENHLPVRDDMSDDDLRAALRGSKVPLKQVVSDGAHDDPSRFGGHLAPQAQEQIEEVTPEDVPDSGLAEREISRDQLEAPIDKKGRASLGR